MDYEKLAAELIDCMGAVRRVKTQKDIYESLRGEGVVLQCLLNHNKDMQPGEISMKMSVSGARIAATLNGLEKKGLITRRIDENNRRQIIVRITQKGREMSQAHQKNMVSITVNMLRLLGERDAVEYVRITKRLAQILPDCEDKLVK